MLMIALGSMPEASSLGLFFIGVSVGIFFDYLWRIRISKYEKRVAIFEHYHWGLASLILARVVKIFGAAFAGLGLCLIFAELTQRHPFATASNHELSSTIIGLILAIPLIFAYVTL
jgi:hypothetical protein